MGVATGQASTSNQQHQGTPKRSKNEYGLSKGSVASTTCLHEVVNQSLHVAVTLFCSCATVEMVSAKKYFKSKRL